MADLMPKNIVVDVKPLRIYTSIKCNGRCYCQCGRWNSHCSVDIIMADVNDVKAMLYIRVNNPSLNKNIGKYHLPHIWDEVLFNTSELKLK